MVKELLAIAIRQEKEITDIKLEKISISRRQDSAVECLNVLTTELLDLLNTLNREAGKKSTLKTRYICIH
jgi:hypothetical protein